MFDILNKVKQGKDTIINLSEEARKEFIYSGVYEYPEQFENYGKYNFYELHITIEPDISFNIEKFKEDCNILKVKPMVIELLNREGVKVGEDVGTSSKYNCNFEEIYEKIINLVKDLQDKNYNVTRVKLESSDIHPLANKHLMFNIKTPGCYLESHLRIVCNDNHLPLLNKLANNYNLYLSKNTFKKMENGDYIIMLTYRNNDLCPGIFREELEYIINHLKNEGLEIINENSDYLVEFIVFDTNVKHDDKWLKSS